jgi:hypothetical protein
MKIVMRKCIDSAPHCPGEYRAHVPVYIERFHNANKPIDQGHRVVVVESFLGCVPCPDLYAQALTASERANNLLTHFAAGRGNLLQLSFDLRLRR